MNLQELMPVNSIYRSRFAQVAHIYICETRKAYIALIGFWCSLFIPCWLVINGIYDWLASNQKHAFIVSMYECGIIEGSQKEPRVFKGTIHNFGQMLNIFKRNLYVSA